ncbi:MAG: GC-type dockerin domain-anchored protein [Phycisphaerales bacterium]
MSGAAEAGYWQPSEGISSASFVLVPLDDTTSRVTHAVVSSLLWTGERWERVVLGEFERGADMLTEVLIDLRSIPEASYGSDLDLLVEWMEGDEFLTAFDHFLPIHESANPGDFNRDGERNADDLVAFLDAYDNNAPRADLNYDGVVDAADLELFLMHFDAN